MSTSTQEINPNDRPDPWWHYLLPMAAYIAGNNAEPYLLAQFGQSLYPAIYAVKLVLTAVCLALAWPTLKKFSWRISPLAIATGIVGIVVWVGLHEASRAIMGVETEVQAQSPTVPEENDPFADEPASAPAKVTEPSPAGNPSGRVGFNPYEVLGGNQAALMAFLAVRILGMVLIVPIVEELFLRGFLVRLMEHADWWKLPIGQMTYLGFVSAAVYGMAMHPGEFLAAGVWFTLISWLAWRTRSLSDCVVAHGVTNLLLGAYVLTTESWELW